MRSEVAVLQPQQTHNDACLSHSILMVIQPMGKDILQNQCNGAILRMGYLAQRRLSGKYVGSCPAKGNPTRWWQDGLKYLPR